MGTSAITLCTQDGVRLRGLALTGPADPSSPAIVVGHGFTHSTARPATQRLLRGLARYGAVIAPDFRGHGRSGGGCTVGDAEVYDVAAAVDWARDHGHDRVVTLGFSMGGGVAVRHAARFGGVAAVAVVSPVTRWYYRDTRPMRRVHWLLESRTGRAVARYGLGVRLGPRWTDPPPSPLDVAGQLECPLLIVHGDADTYFPVDHAVALADAAPTAELWIEPGFGHAENAMTPALLDRVARWLVTASRQDSGTISL
jgi:pimeloyl-ACP methyl ester carboxylesterase